MLLAPFEQVALPTIVSLWQRLCREARQGVTGASLATGVDAPGSTNSLVVIDRIPRSPGNPMDDARVAEIQERTGDRWSADRAVYATDASLLLSQAAGRLIRAEADRGMVCCLDPRLLKGSPLTYPAATRGKYMKPLSQFGRTTATLADAVAWLEGRQVASRDAVGR